MAGSSLVILRDYWPLYMMELGPTVTLHVHLTNILRTAGFFYVCTLHVVQENNSCHEFIKA